MNTRQAARTNMTGVPDEVIMHLMGKKQGNTGFLCACAKKNRDQQVPVDEYTNTSINGGIIY